MMPLSRFSTSDGSRRPGGIAAFVIAAAAFSCISVAAAQPNSPILPRGAVFKAPAEQGVRWSELKPAQQSALKPLEREWVGIDAPRKQKWVELSARYPTMSPAEQARVQDRMSAWAKLTPQERGQARLNFQEAKQVPAQDRQARWDAYQALSPEQKQAFAARGAPVSAATRKTVAAGASTEKSAREAPQAKSNIVPNPAFSVPPKAVAPTVVQARPGATTTPVTKLAAPPPHQQTGQPKIAATPEFVNKDTLLPQRGPQGAATRPAVASSVAVPAQKE